MKLSLAKFLILLISAGMLSGCSIGSFCRDWEEEIFAEEYYFKISSDPPGASIYLNDKFVGTTPVKFTVPADEFDYVGFSGKKWGFCGPLELTVDKFGYRPVYEKLDKRDGRHQSLFFTLQSIPGVAVAAPPDEPEDDYEDPFPWPPKLDRGYKIRERHE